MPHNPKLEIYRLQLLDKQTGNPVKFREFFAQKFNRYGRKDNKIFTDTDIVKEFYQDFIKQIDTKYHLSDPKKKGFKASKGDASGQQHTITFQSAKRVIKGRLKGGTHGRKGFMGAIDDADNDTAISIKNIVGYDFYFLLHTPLDHHEGVVFIQGYSGMTISDVFREFLLKYFKHSKIIRSKIAHFYPKALKDKYIEDAVFRSIQFSSDWVIDPDRDNHIQKKYAVEVKVEIIDKSENPTKPSAFAKIIDVLSLGKFVQGKKEKKLNEFKKQKPKMISDGKLQAIDLANLSNIKPVLLLEKVGIQVSKDLVPNFGQIDNYCSELLPEVLNEILPSNAVKDI